MPNTQTISKEKEKSLIIDNITTLNVTYIGKSQIGTSENESLWQIQKLDETTGLLKKLWADGNSNYDNIWTNRVSLTYS